MAINLFVRVARPDDLVGRGFSSEGLMSMRPLLIMKKLNGIGPVQVSDTCLPAGRQQAMIRITNAG